MTHQRSNKKTLVILAVLTLVGVLFASQATMATELTLMHCWGDHRTPMVEAMVDQFEKEHPGVTVTTQLKSCGKPLQEAFLTAYAGGVAPDVVMISSSLIPATVNSGALLPVSQWMQRDGITEDTWFPSEIDSSRWNGLLYGLPIRTGGDANSLMFYNIDLLDNLGIGTVPKTWDELNAMARKIVRYDGEQISRVAFTPHGGDMPSPGWLASGGGKLYSDDGKEALFANPAAIGLGTFLQDHFTGFYTGGLRAVDATIGTSQAARLSAFTSGKLAFNFDGSWIFSFIKDQDPDLRYGVALRPTRELGGLPGLHAKTFHYAVPSGVANPELSWELVKWLTLKQETAGKFMFDQERASPVIQFSRNPEYWRINPYWNVVIEALTRSAKLPNFPYTDDVAVLFGNALRKVMRGDEAPTTALSAAARQAQAQIDEYWQSVK